jgi:hypothetical protein
MTSRKPGARPSTCRPWCSAIWATQSATGVAFTRNPSTGAKELYGEFLVNAQGEDVVAGIRTPQSITESCAHRGRRWTAVAGKADAGCLCRVSRHLRPARKPLPRHAGLEFTIQAGKLWMLQTRSGKRTAKAALKIAVDMAGEGLISREEAVLRHRPGLARPASAPHHRSACGDRDIIASGLPASPGAATGEIVFTSEEAEEAAASGPQGHSGAGGNQPGRHSRHARRRRHSDLAWRHDQPRRRCRPRHGQALASPAPVACASTRERHVVTLGANAEGRRRHHH